MCALSDGGGVAHQDLALMGESFTLEEMIPAAGFLESLSEVIARSET